MVKRYVILMMLVLVLCSVSIMAQDEDVIRQWATYASATSEYSATNWSAMQATGEPDVLKCGDDTRAWASATVSESEALTVMFESAVYPLQLNIHQSYNPGAIVAVELIVVRGESNIVLENSADTNTKNCPGIFPLNIEDVNVPIAGAIIYLEQSLIGDWNEIDAVELVGQVAEDVDYTFEGPSGKSVTCENGGSFDNGVEVIVIQMRTGFTYTATALGLNGFDPVLAVLGESGRGLCTDDDQNAVTYSAYLPTTDLVEPNSTNSQVPFANNGSSAFGNISLVVGGYENQSGEFLLILEGMALTNADGEGDPFSLQITPGMIASGVNPSVYMISVTNSFDPLIAMIDSDYEFMTDSDGNYIACDDAGVAENCWGDSFELSPAYVSRTQGRQLPGGPYDAMLTLPIEEGMENGYLNFLMRSSGMRTFGDYMVVFHIGIGGQND